MSNTRDSYSNLVKWMKVTCLIVLLILFCLLIFADMFNSKSKINVQLIEKSETNSEKKEPSKIIKPKFYGFSSKKEPYSVKAEQSYWFEKNKYFLEGINADITLKNSDWFFLVSQKGYFIEEEEILNLRKEVNLFYNYDHRLKTEFLKVNLNDFSCSNNHLTNVDGPKFEISSDRFSFISKINRSKFEKNVKSKFKTKEDNLFINAEVMQIFHNDMKAIYLKKVKAWKGKLKLFSNKLEILYDKDIIKKAIASEEVVLEDEKMKITSNFAEYIEEKNIIIMKDNVIVDRNDTIVKGQKLIYDIENQTSKMLDIPTNNNNNGQNRSRIILKN